MNQFAEHLFRGPRPPSMQWLRDNGFKRVINLQSGIFEFFHQDRYESEIDKEFGIYEFNFPMSDFTAPKVDTLKTIAEILNYSHLNGIKTYVHCAFGVDRTGMTVASYRILHNGFSVRDATKEMFKQGFHKWPYLHIWNWPKQLDKLK